MIVKGKDIKQKIEVLFAQEYDLECDQKVIKLSLIFLKSCNECKQFKKIERVFFEFGEFVEIKQLADLFRNVADMVEKRFK